MDFHTILLVALQSDYLMCLLNLKGEDALEFSLPKELYPVFNEANQSMRLDAGFYQADNDLDFIYRFHSLDAQERFINNISGFNHSVRKQFGIPLPNLYMGKSTIDLEVVEKYLQEIKEFFGSDYEGTVKIPVDLIQGTTIYCTCDKHGIQK